jgi:hypothetical protein
LRTEIAWLLLFEGERKCLPVQAKYGGGTGEPNDPYLIYDANQMNAIGADQNDWDNHFLLCADIDLSVYTGTEFNIIGRGRYSCLPPPFGDCSLVFTPFSGVFDGNGHTISNFTYEFTGNKFVGLFGCVVGENAKIKNLNLSNVDIDVYHDGNDPDKGAAGSLIGLLYDGTVIGCSQDGSVSGDIYYHVGGLVGFNQYGTISHCISMCTVSGYRYVGGLVGRNHYGTISDCYSNASAVGVREVGGLVGSHEGTITESYSTGTVSGSDYVGGLTGFSFGTITDSYSTGSVSGVAWVGGLVGENYTGIIDNSYSTGNVKGASNVGGLIGLNYNNFGEITDSFWDVNTSGLADSDGGVGKTTVEMQTESTFTDAGWDFVGETVNGPNDIWRNCEGEGYPRLAWEEYEKYGGGTGEPNDPYLIYTPCQMNEIGADANDWDNHFLLCADIDLSEYTGTEFNIIGVGRWDCTLDLCRLDGTPFTGVFDGNGHTISNFTYEYIGDKFTGLFGYVHGESAQIKNLDLRDVDIDVQHSGGDPDYGATGSLIGELFDGTVIGCYIQGGNLSGGSRVGGMVGVNDDGTITNCYSTGSVSGSSYVGGLVGGGTGTITYCYSNGHVSGSDRVGGLAGGNFGNISDCYATGSVSGDDTVGGLVGMNGLCIPDYGCYPGTISDSYSVGSVSGDSLVGGLVGHHEFGSVNDCFWDVNTSGLDNSGGGMGKTTAEMQTKSTFTDTGWDFVGETVNGPNDIWDICEGTNYPKFVWQIPPGDFLCPDGVNFFDYSFFALQWTEVNCAVSNDCDGRDLDLLGSVDIEDLRIFADNWLAGL